MPVPARREHVPHAVEAALDAAQHLPVRVLQVAAADRALGRREHPVVLKWKRERVLYA